MILKVYRLVMTFSSPDPITRARSTLDGAVISLTPCHFPRAQETASRRAPPVGDDFQENIVPRREELPEENSGERSVRRRKLIEAYGSQEKVHRNRVLRGEIFQKTAPGSN
jgi:hypothetical protein